MHEINLIKIRVNISYYKIKLVRTDASNRDFIELVKQLDEVLCESDGDEHSFFAQFNKLDELRNAVVVYVNNIPAGCGAIKKNSERVAEIKRMFVRHEFRGQGVARMVLKELEMWAAELSYSECILETGRKLTAAIGLYQSSGYEVTPNYGQYIGVELSVCFRKKLK